MTFTPCSVCCECDDCTDSPQKIVITVSHESGGGTMIDSDPPVTTGCVPDPSRIGISHFIITDSGSGYSSIPTVTLSGGGDEAVHPPLLVAVESAVVSVQITNGGTGYTSAPSVSFTPPSPIREYYVAATGVADIRGPIASLTLTKRGADYLTPPLVTIDDGIGVNATAEATLTGYIKSIDITNEGSGYLSTPTVTLVGGGGSGASATALRGQFVQSVQVTNSGSNYLDTPKITFSGGGGGGAVAFPWVLVGCVDEIRVVDGGSGYSSPPTVTITGGGGEGAQAVAGIEGGKVTSVTVTVPGRAYRSGPFVGASFFTDAVFQAEVDTSGSVVAIHVVSEGFWPTVTPTFPLFISGGGGSGAQGTITRGYRVYGIQVDNAGTGYTSPPTVSFSGGGGGTGLAATATLGKHIGTLSVTNAGSGYGPSPTVRFFGGGGAGAVATATINGSVSAVRLTNSGLYAIGAATDLSGSYGWPAEWPTISFLGGGGSGAQATPQFSGRLAAISLLAGNLPGSHYTQAPTVTITGGGGQDAAAVAYLTYQQSHTIVHDLWYGFEPNMIRPKNCLEDVQYGYYFDAEAADDAFPLPNCPGDFPPSAKRFGEHLGWRVRASINSDIVIQPIITPGQEEDSPLLFAGEAMWVELYRDWAAGFPNFSERRVYLRRAFTRVPPNSEYATDNCPQESTPARVSLVTEQSDDLKGDPFWRVTGLTLVSGGNNLWIPKSTPVTNPPTFSPYPMTRVSGNTLLQDVTASITAKIDPPLVLSVSTVETGTNDPVPFTSIPSFAFVFASAADHGDYLLQSASVTDGGSTAASDGACRVVITALSRGFLATPPENYGDGTKYIAPELTATITGGTITAVAVSQPGLVRGGGSITAVTLGGEQGTVTAGASGFLTTETYSQPLAISASASTAGTPAEFSVVLSGQKTDVNGNPYWQIKSVAVKSPGTGYTDFEPLVFTVGPGDIASEHAAAEVVLGEKTEPTLSVSPPDGGSGAVLAVNELVAVGENWGVANVAVVDGGEGYTNNAALTITPDTGSAVEQYAVASVVTREEPEISATVAGGEGAVLEVVLTEDIPNQYWFISAINVISGGSGYDQEAAVTFSGGEQEFAYAFAHVNVNESGAITSVTVTSTGQFWDDDGVIQRVTITEPGAYYAMPGVSSVRMLDGGKYFRRTITETQTKLPEQTCIGSVTDNWEQRFYRGQSEPYEVGDLVKDGPDCPAIDFQPSVVFLSETGSGAEACATVGNTDEFGFGEITAITMTSGGQGYLTAPGVQVNAALPGGGFVGTATVSSGEVTGVTIDEGGSGYVAGYPCLRTRRCPLPTIEISFQ